MDDDTAKPIIDDTSMDKVYRKLGGHNTNSQTLTKTEKELIKAVDNALDSYK